MILLGMDWIKTFQQTIGRIHMAENNQSQKERILMKLPNRFENKDTIKITAIIFQLKLGDYAVKQQARPVPPHLQEDVGRELEKLIRSGHLGKSIDVEEDCIVSSLGSTVKSDKFNDLSLFTVLPNEETMQSSSTSMFFSKCPDRINFSNSRPTSSCRCGGTGFTEIER